MFLPPAKTKETRDSLLAFNLLKLGLFSSVALISVFRSDQDAITTNKQATEKVSSFKGWAAKAVQTPGSVWTEKNMVGQERLIAHPRDAYGTGSIYGSRDTNGIADAVNEFLVNEFLLDAPESPKQKKSTPTTRP